MFAGCATTPTMESVAGEYYKGKGKGGLHGPDNDVYKNKHLLANGMVEDYYNGAKQTQHSAQWSIVNGYIHVPYARGATQVWRINADRIITHIAHIDYGKWAWHKIGERPSSSGKYTPIAKEGQPTYIKIK